MAKFTSSYFVPGTKNIDSDVAADFANKLANEVVLWAASHYNLNHVWLDEFQVRLRTAQTRGGTSWGGTDRNGRPCINLKMRTVTHAEYVDFGEYKHIAQDPHIGAMGKVHWTIATAALVCHEVAHAVHIGLESWLYNNDPNGDARIPHPITKKYLDTSKWTDGCHGQEWQTIYHTLREQFVNNGLPTNIVVGPGKREKNLEKKAIGTVDIKFGAYRNRFVSGKFDLLKSFTPHKGENRFCKRGDGYVTIRTPKGLKLRVNVHKRHIEEQLND